MLENQALEYFKNLFTSKNVSTEATLQLATLHALSDEAICQLQSEVTYAEIYATLKSMKSYSSPRPDGFPVIFNKRDWDLVHHHVTKMVKQAFCIGHFQSSIGGTLISPIPKNNSPASFADLRPINLCNVV